MRSKRGTIGELKKNGREKRVSRRGTKAHVCTYQYS